MKITRMLFVLSAVVLASPAMAGEASDRDAGRDDVTATAPHACPAHKDRDGKVRCACASGQEVVTPEPVFTDAG